MSTYALLLRISAPIFFIVGALHLAFGLGSEVMLGTVVGPDALASAGLDSQNRFYGVAFTLYGALLWVCAADIRRYAPILRCVFWVFLAAGLARLVSIATHGLPPPMILGLLVTEITAPPVMLIWLSRLLKR